MAEPRVEAEIVKALDPGGSIIKKESEPESKLLQANANTTSQRLEFESRRFWLRDIEKSENKNSISFPVSEKPVGTVKLRVWEKVTGNVTAVAFPLNKVATVVAKAKEDASELPGPLAKPDTNAVAVLAGDTDAVPVAMALPWNDESTGVLPGKKEMLVPNGSAPGVESET
jgi:hypothetical protein